jgi:uncharacterized protein YdaU (DUF1376 family)
MAKVPAFQFYAADYLADEHVQLMSLEEEGAYIRALAYCWREGSIPADPEALSRLLKGGSTTLVRVVQARFKQHPEFPDRMVHPRLEEERQKQKNWRVKSAEGGKQSAAKRQKRKADSRVVQPPYQPNIDSVVEPNGNSSSSSSSSSLDQKKEKEHSAFAEFMRFLSRKIGPIPNGAKEGKAIKWLTENGYDFALCCECYEFLAGEKWRTATVTWTTVKAEIGGWLSKGKVGNGQDQSRFESAPERNARNLRENVAYIRGLQNGSGEADSQDPIGLLAAGA